MEYWKSWIKAAGIRAAKTFAEVATASIGMGAAFGEVSWLEVISQAGLSTILSLITSLAGLPELEANGTKSWILAAGVRALKTVAQAAISVISTAVMIGEVDWIRVASVAAVSGIESILISIAGIPEAEKK